MEMSLRNWIVAALTAVIVLPSAAFAAPTLLNPTPYRSFADSPFSGLTFGQFFLEDFEDGSMDIPGTTIVSNTPGTSIFVTNPGFFTDSVDGDDGSVDGLGRDGRSIGATPNVPTGNLGYSIMFDEQILGALPTHVGIVWTDGDPNRAVQLEVFDQNGQSLGFSGPASIADGAFNGGTSEDHFFGAINPTGISMITLTQPFSNNNMEMDHLQIGLPQVPLPASGLLFAPVLFGLAGLARRKR